MPKKALTEAAVQRLKPPTTGQVDYFDRGYPGLALRVSFGGGKSFTYHYRVGQRQRRLTLGIFPAMSLAQARKAWRTAREDAQADFLGVFEEWLHRDQAKNKTKGAVERLIRKDVIPVWGHRQITSLGRRDVLDVIDGVADRGSPITARRLHAHIHRLFRWAVGRGIIEANPASDLPKPGAETKRDRVLLDDELKAIWDGAGQLGWPFGDVVRLLILTGARRDEIGSLRWSEIAGDVINLKGERTKNAEPHIIPLSRPATNILNRMPRLADSERVFTTNGKTSGSGWSRAKARLDVVAGVDDWRLHDLRRTVATGLQKLGVALVVIEAVLGHMSG